MEKIEKFFKENPNEFELAKRQAIRFIEKNKEELNKAYESSIQPDTEEAETGLFQEEAASGKKRVLVLCSGKLTREDQELVKHLLESDEMKACSGRLYGEFLGTSDEAEKFWKTCEQVKQIPGKGRMPISEEDWYNYKILEKNPEIYLNNTEVQEYLDGLLEQEWKRLFGSEKWDALILIGTGAYLNYYLSVFAKIPKKFLVDLGFLPYIQEKYPMRWQELLLVFDRVYVPISCENLNVYGKKMASRTERLPVLSGKKKPEGEKRVTYKGEPYLVCDSWKEASGERALKLAKLPKAGGILVNGENMPSEIQKRKLMELSHTHKLYILGKAYLSYVNFLPEAEVLNAYVGKELYLYPAAWDYFGSFEGYVGNSSGADGSLDKICDWFGVKKIL